VPRAKASARQRLARPPALARASDRADDISAQRDALVAEVKRLQDALGTSARFATKARDLLTRAWSKADWDGRQDLLKAAQWLVQLETIATLTRR